MRAVSHLSFSSAGGAGETARILNHNMVKLGYPSSLVTMTNSDLRKEPLRNPLITGAAIWDNKIVKRDHWASLITLSRSDIGALGALDSLGQIVHHHWIQGMINKSQLLGIAASGRKQAFTVNDMRFFTGACHYSFSCRGFESGCQDCPAVKPPFKRAVKNSVEKFHHTITQVFQKSAPLIVTPTPWMKKQIENSKIGQNLDVQVVPNPIKDLFFEPSTVRDSNTAVPLRICIVARFLDDPVKGVLAFLDEAINSGLHGIEINLVGRLIDNRRELPRNVIRHGWLEPEELRSLLDVSDYLVMPSIAEAAGNVIAEAAARGVPTLGLGGTGVEDMVLDGTTGLIFKQAGDIAIYLQRTHNQHLHRKISAAARETSTRWSGETIARMTVDLYDRVFGPEENFG